MLPAGQTELRCSIPHLPLPRGRFYLWFGVFEHTGDLVPWHPVSQFEVLGPELVPTPRGIVRLAPIELAPSWEVEQDDAAAPLVSVGVPVYNGEEYLPAALDALLAQDLDDFEVIVCDNASTDATAEIAREYAAHDDRVRYHRNARNLGLSGNFNRAFQLSRGSTSSGPPTTTGTPRTAAGLHRGAGAGPVGGALRLGVAIMDDDGEVFEEWHPVDLLTPRPCPVPPADLDPRRDPPAVLGDAFRRAGGRRCTGRSSAATGCCWPSSSSWAGSGLPRRPSSLPPGADAAGGQA